MHPTPRPAPFSAGTHQQGDLDGGADHLVEWKLAQRRRARAREPRRHVPQDVHGGDAALVEQVCRAGAGDDDDEEGEAGEVVPGLEEPGLHALGRGWEGALDQLHAHEHGEAGDSDRGGGLLGQVQVPGGVVGGKG